MVSVIFLCFGKSFSYNKPTYRKKKEKTMNRPPIEHELTSSDQENATFLFNLQKRLSTDSSSIDSLFSELLQNIPRERRRSKLVKLGGDYLHSAYQRHIIISQLQNTTSTHLTLFNWWLFLRFDMKHTFVQVSRLFDQLQLSAPHWSEIKSSFRKLDTLYSDFQFRFQKLDFTAKENWQKSAQPILVQHIRQAFTRGMRESILNAPFNEVIGIRPILAQTTANELVSLLQAEKIPARLSRRTEYGVICHRHSPLRESSAYKNELFNFLDEADELLLELIFPFIGNHNCFVNNPAPFFPVALNDLCQYETQLRNVVNGPASTPKKVPIFTSLDYTELGESTQPAQLFDSVIHFAIDSQSGFIAQNPLFKNNITPDFIEKNGETIRQQLEFCASRVKNGGYLLFSSHSVLPAETDLLISDFLARHPEFHAQSLQDELLKNYKRTCFTPFGFTTAPYVKQMNGVFLSVMQKNENAAA
jgi:hypothetical protein